MLFFLPVTFAIYIPSLLPCVIRDSLIINDNHIYNLDDGRLLGLNYPYDDVVGDYLVKYGNSSVVTNTGVGGGYDNGVGGDFVGGGGGVDFGGDFVESAAGAAAAAVVVVVDAAAGGVGGDSGDVGDFGEIGNSGGSTGSIGDFEVSGGSIGDSGASVGSIGDIRGAGSDSTDFEISGGDSTDSKFTLGENKEIGFKPAVGENNINPNIKDNHIPISSDYHYISINNTINIPLFDTSKFTNIKLLSNLSSFSINFKDLIDIKTANNGLILLLKNSVKFLDNLGNVFELVEDLNEIDTSNNGTISTQPSSIIYNIIDSTPYLIIHNQIHTLSIDNKNIVSTSNIPLNEEIISFHFSGIFTTKSMIYLFDGVKFTELEKLKTIVDGDYNGDKLKVGGSLKYNQSTSFFSSDELFNSLNSFTPISSSHIFFNNSIYDLDGTLAYKFKPSSYNLLHHGLSTYLFDSKIVYDLTDFLILNDPNSIKLIKNKLNGDHFFISNDFELVSIDSNSWSIEKLDLADGTSTKSSQNLFQFNSDSILIDLNHHSETETLNLNSNFIILNWFFRVRKHFAEFGEYVFNLITNLGEYILNLVENESSEDIVVNKLEKIVVFYDKPKLEITALDTVSGVLVWSTKVVGFKSISEFNDQILIVTDSQLLFIDAKTGLVANAVFESTPIIPVSGLVGSTQKTFLAIQKDSRYRLFDFDGDSPTEDIYFISSTENTIIGNRIPTTQSESINTWKFEKPGEEIVKVNGKSPYSQTASIGIPLSDKRVLYKYLNPSTVVIVTKDLEKNLHLYLIDGITGNIILKESHTEENIDYSSINIIHDDNWIVYSFFDFTNFEQRVNVIDLFDEKPNSSDEPISIFESNSTLNNYFKKSYIYPERINALSSTQSKHGITLKSIVIASDIGGLVQIPKYILNSRRIDDREFTNQDALDDYRLSPYSPSIPRNDYAVSNPESRLNTKNGKFLIKPTEYESTSVICYINSANLFCTLIQPSSSFDLLGSNFDKLKLFGTISIILIAYLVSKPFVENKKLKSEWLN